MSSTIFHGEGAEAENGQVALREHGVGDKGVMTVDEMMVMLKGLENG